MCANCANSFWQTWALAFLPGFCESAMSAMSAMSAKSFWPTRALLKTTGFGEAAEITAITVSTFGRKVISAICERQSPGEQGIARKDSHALLGGRATLDWLR